MHLTIKLECYVCGGALGLEHNENNNVIRVRPCDCQTTNATVDVLDSMIVIGEKDG